MDLQSWLVMDETRVSFTCQQEHLLSTAQFMEELRTTIRELQLPLSVEVQKVKWVDGDRTITTQDRIIVKNTVNADIKLLAGIDVYGLITIVERKTVLDPPIKSPERFSVPDNLPGAGLGCGASFIFGLFSLGTGGLNGGAGGIFWWLLAGGTFVYAIYAYIVNGGYNQQRAELDTKQKQAILDWIEKIVRVAEKSKIDSSSVNLSTALDQALRATSKRVYEERGAVKTAEEKQIQTASELRDSLTRRESALK